MYKIIDAIKILHGKKVLSSQRASNNKGNKLPSLPTLRLCVCVVWGRQG